mgnify:CR=1 FL=1
MLDANTVDGVIQEALSKIKVSCIDPNSCYVKAKKGSDNSSKFTTVRGVPPEAIISILRDAIEKKESFVFPS